MTPERDGEFRRGQREGFAARLRNAREARGWSQIDLARRTRVGQSQVSAYELGKLAPKAYVLAALAEAVGLTMDELWNGPKGGDKP